MIYQLSKYNYPFKVKENYFLYNILSTSIIELEEEIYNSICSSSFSSLPNEILEELFNEGFLVEKDSNEVEKYEYYYNHARFEENLHKLKVTILPTYSCNLACPYCFEGTNKAKNIMSLENAKSILNFIKTETACKDTKELYISFFGGEPFIAKDVITFFCNQLTSFAREHKIDVIYDITTNLTLLDNDIINLIKEHNVAIQVTLDGLKENHDIRRCYRDGRGTYDLILTNLEKLYKKGLKELVSIRINVDNKNVNDAESVLNIACKYANHVYFGFIKEYSDFNKSYKNKCIPKECFAHYDITLIHKLYEKMGVTVPVEFGKRAPCTINSENCFIINDKLDVYKCEVLQNIPECKVGVINNGEFVPNKNFYHQMAICPTQYKKCRECFLLPLCGGGCPGEKYINDSANDGCLHRPDCITNEKILNAYLVDYVNRHSGE